jgi:transcriptional regulator with XRE-family HTH domain
MPVSIVFENLESGATIDEIVEWFDVTREEILAALEFVAQSLEAPAPVDMAPKSVKSPRRSPRNLSVLRHTNNYRAGVRAGREPAGLYPEISRTKLARACGSDCPTMVRVLNGSRRPSLELAAAVAKVVGVTVERLMEDLAGVRASRQQAGRQAGRNNASQAPTPK